MPEKSDGQAPRDCASGAMDDADWIVKARLTSITYQFTGQKESYSSEISIERCGGSCGVFTRGGARRGTARGPESSGEAI
eukprot:8915403-Pyramimonas_sp.AAC.1